MDTCSRLGVIVPGIGRRSQGKRRRPSYQGCPCERSTPFKLIRYARTSRRVTIPFLRKVRTNVFRGNWSVRPRIPTQYCRCRQKGGAHRVPRIRWFLLPLARHGPYTAPSDKTLQHSLHIHWAGTALWHPPAIIDFLLHVVIRPEIQARRYYNSEVPPFGHWPLPA